MTNWENPADDKRMKEATNRLGTMVQKEAHNLNLLVNFTYLNYANKDQSVYKESLTPEDLARMLRIRDEYDPSGIFRTMWRGGFKLPETIVERDIFKDEL
jgi:FAD/FMN-containing dehydrogenase